MQGDELKARRRALRQFGGVLGGLLLLTGLLVWERSPWSGAALLCLGGGVAWAFCREVPGTAVFFDGWMRFARVTSALFTRVVLFLVFVLVIIPTGALARLVGKRFLQLDQPAESYWCPRRPDTPDDRQY